MKIHGTNQICAEVYLDTETARLVEQIIAKLEGNARASRESKWWPSTPGLKVEKHGVEGKGSHLPIQNLMIYRACDESLTGGSNSHSRDGPPQHKTYTACRLRQHTSHWGKGWSKETPMPKLALNWVRVIPQAPEVTSRACTIHSDSIHPTQHHSNLGKTHEVELEGMPWVFQRLL